MNNAFYRTPDSYDSILETAYSFFCSPYTGTAATSQQEPQLPAQFSYSNSCGVTDPYCSYDNDTGEVTNDIPIYKPYYDPSCRQVTRNTHASFNQSNPQNIPFIPNSPTIQDTIQTTQPYQQLNPSSSTIKQNAPIFRDMPVIPYRRALQCESISTDFSGHTQFTEKKLPYNDDAVQRTPQDNYIINYPVSTPKVQKFSYNRNIPFTRQDSPLHRKPNVQLTQSSKMSIHKSRINQTNLAAPFRTTNLYNCPFNGPIYCTLCSATLPSYTIAVAHFNSPKHRRKVLVAAPESSDEKSDQQAKANSLECKTCKMKPGSVEAYIQHYASPRHLKKLNRIGSETRAFSILCDPCQEHLNTIESLNDHCKSEGHFNKIRDKFKEIYPDIRKASQFYCEVCDKACNSVMTYEVHCNSQKHKSKISERNRAKSGTEMGGDGNLNRSVTDKVDDLFNCKICVFSTSEKLLIDRHYETEGHRANKLLKRRYDELYRVSDVAKRKYPKIATDIIPLNSKGPCHCQICDLYFAHRELLDIHFEGRLHSDLELRYKKAQNAPPRIHVEGFRCKACNLHTSCITVYTLHVKSKAHRQKSQNWSKNEAEITDEVEDIPDDGIGEGVKGDDSRYHCKYCNIYVMHKHSYLQHCKGRKHQNKTKIIQDDDSSKELFRCVECSVSCYTKGEVAKHLTSDEHNKRGDISACSAPTNKPTATSLFFCETCNIDCRSQSAYDNHLTGIKHLRRSFKPKEEDDGCSVKRKRPGFECELCNAKCKSQDQLDCHLKSFKHLSKASLIQVSENFSTHSRKRIKL